MHARILVASLASMALLTFTSLAVMFLRRMTAIKRKQIRVREFQTYANEEKWPEKVVIASRHYKNLFEMPVLFYMIVMLVLVDQSENGVTSALAILYVLLRVAHSCVHLGNNNVLLRMRWFGSSALVLAALWVYGIGNIFL